MEWKKIQEEFDANIDVNEIFYFLRGLVDVLCICTTSECKIFPEIHNLDLRRMDFEITTPELAKTTYTNEKYLREWNYKYKAFRIESKRVFAKIYALKVSKDTMEKELDKSHENFMEIIKEMNKSNIPFPIDFQKGLQDQIDKYGNSLKLEDPRITKERERFKKEMNNRKKEELKDES